MLNITRDSIYLDIYLYLCKLWFLTVCLFFALKMNIEIYSKRGQIVYSVFTYQVNLENLLNYWWKFIRVTLQIIVRSIKVVWDLIDSLIYPNTQCLMDLKLTLTRNAWWTLSPTLTHKTWWTLSPTLTRNA